MNCCHFKKFAKYRPQDCVLLLDTYSTLKSGPPNAITVAKEMEKSGQRLMGVRLDSGDLASLSKACREALDEAELDYVKIIATQDWHPTNHSRFAKKSSR